MSNKKEEKNTIIRDIISAIPGQDINSAKEIAVLLQMPDKEFEIISSIFIEELQKSLRLPQQKQIMYDTLKKDGVEVTELINLYTAFNAQVDSLSDSLSECKKDFLKTMIGCVINAISEVEGVANKIIQIPIEKMCDEAIIPKYARIGDAGMDVFSLEDYEVKPGETVLVHTGIKMEIPKGYEMQIRPKSGIALKTKLRVANTPGTIDSGYRGEVCIIVENIEQPLQDIEYDFNDDGSIRIKSILHGKSYFIGKGEKVAQCILKECPMTSFIPVARINELTERGVGGFGSTGLKVAKR